MATNANWKYVPQQKDYPDAYQHRSHDMLVIQRGERWDAYSLRYGSAVEGVFVTAAEAIEWCEARPQ